jgi:hypothetical protein
MQVATLLELDPHNIDSIFIQYCNPVERHFAGEPKMANEIAGHNDNNTEARQENPVQLQVLTSSGSPGNADFFSMRSMGKSTNNSIGNMIDGFALTEATRATASGTESIETGHQLGGEEQMKHRISGRTAGKITEGGKPADSAEDFGASIQRCTEERQDMAAKLKKRDQLIDKRFAGQDHPSSAHCHELIDEYNRARDKGERPPQRVTEQMKTYGFLEMQEAIYELAKKNPDCREIERLTNERDRLAHCKLYENMRPFVTAQLIMIDAANSDSEQAKLTRELIGSNPLGLRSLLRERDKPILREIAYLQLQLNRKIAGRSR